MFKVDNKITRTTSVMFNSKFHLKRKETDIYLKPLETVNPPPSRLPSPHQNAH